MYAVYHDNKTLTIQEIIFVFWHIPARLKFIGRPHYFTYILLFPVAHNNWPGFNSFLYLHNIDFLQIFHTIKSRNCSFFLLHFVTEQAKILKKIFHSVDLEQLLIPWSQTMIFSKLRITIQLWSAIRAIIAWFSTYFLEGKMYHDKCFVKMFNLLEINK